MGVFDNFKKKMSGEDDIYDPYNDNDNSYFQGFGAEPETEDPAVAQPVSSAMSSGIGSGISLAGNAIELKVVKPERFDSVPQIADHLLSKRTVVLNLENTNKETARRLIDFLSGVAYSIDGQLKKIANNAYVITPSNVDVSGEALRDKRPAAPEASPVEEKADPFGEY